MTINYQKWLPVLIEMPKLIKKSSLNFKEGLMSLKQLEFRTLIKYIRNRNIYLE